jgi:hypothetical protein
MRATRRWRAGGVAGTALALLAVGPAARAPAEDGGERIPFPVGKTTIVRAEGKAYEIDGAQVIPPNAEVTVQLGVRIYGVNNASLDVQGGLKVHGTEGSWVVIDHVDFSPTVAPKRGFHLDMADLVGCRFKHGETQSFGGEITIENSCLQRDCEFDVRVTGGFLKIMTTEFGMPCRIRCDRQRENPVPIELEIRSSWMKEVFLSGTGTANFRHSEIRAGLECRGVTDVTVDGCDVGGKLAFLQGPDDSFSKVTLTKVNMFGSTLVLERPQGPRTKAERVKLDKFYFGPKSGGGATSDKDVGALITDKDDDPAQTVKAWWGKPADTPHQLVSYGTLRSRAPDLR